MVTTVRRPWWVVRVDLNNKPREHAAAAHSTPRTLVGVLGYVGWISFLLGRLPRWRVTLDGETEVFAGLASPVALAEPLGLRPFAVMMD
jgi:hypothetical protein